MKTDSLFYRLFKTAPELVLELAELDFESKIYEFRSEEIKQTAFRLDGLLVPQQPKAELPIVFVEVQFQPDLYFYSRFFCEIFLYLNQNRPNHTWQALVIYPNRQTETDGRLHYAPLLDCNRVKRIYLEDLTDVPENKIGLQLIQLIIADEQQAIISAQNLLKRIKVQPDQQNITHWLEWIETILVYKLPRLSREEIQNMLGYNDIELKQTRFYQDVYAEGESAIILRLLKRRFGELPKSTQNTIEQLQNQQLEALADQLWEINTLEALSKWLVQADFEQSKRKLKE